MASGFSRKFVGAGWIGILVTVSMICLFSQGHAENETKEWNVPESKAVLGNPIQATAESIATGKNFYIRECLSCHGETGKGDGPGAKDLEEQVPDISLPRMWEQTDGVLFWKTTVGRRPMPSYKKLLSEEERWHVINYVRTLAAQPGGEKK